MANKKVTKMALIDVEMVEIVAHNAEMDTFRWQTASNLDAELQISEGEAVELIVNGRLIAQKRAKDVVTGAQLTVSDNVFAPEIVELIQGGEFVKDENGEFKSYSAPLAGKESEPTKFDFNVYTAQRDMAGDIVSYMRISFPNCTGKPVDIKLENGAFFAPEYTIVSAPNNGESA
jgi:hypothetical protein